MKNWKDIYELPVADSYIDKSDDFRSKRINDNKGNFVFQFMNLHKDAQIKALNAINGVKKLENPDILFTHVNGYILVSDQEAILIRGWGNLTGINGYNLPAEEAANIQDSFADFIVEQLNKR